MHCWVHIFPYDLKDTINVLPKYLPIEADNLEYTQGECLIPKNKINGVLLGCLKSNSKSKYLSINSLPTVSGYVASVTVGWWPKP